MFGPSELLKMNGINSRSNDQPLALPSSVGGEGRIMDTKKIKKLLPELEAARLDGDIIKVTDLQRAIMRALNEDQ